MISDGYTSRWETMLVTGYSFGQGNRLISQGNNTNLKKRKKTIAVQVFNL